MFCSHCGAQVPDGAMFCPGCGERVLELAQVRAQVPASQQPVQANAYIPTTSAAANGFQGVNGVAQQSVQSGTYVPTASPIMANTTQANSNATARTVEGILSIILALVIPFAPMVKISFITTSEWTMMDLVFNLSKFGDYLGKYAIFGPLLAILMVAAIGLSLMNAFRAFNKRKAAGQSPATDDFLSSFGVGMITGYALLLILALFYLKEETYGIGGPTGWAWIQLILAIVNQVVHGIRQ